MEPDIWRRNKRNLLVLNLLLNIFHHILPQLVQICDRIRSFAPSLLFCSASDCDETGVYRRLGETKNGSLLVFAVSQTYFGLDKCGNPFRAIHE